MLPFRIQTEGGVGLLQIATALVPLPLEAGLYPSILVMLTLQGFFFTPVLYGVVTAMNFNIAGILSAFGVCITPVLTVIDGLLLAIILSYIHELLID